MRYTRIHMDSYCDSYVCSLYLFAQFYLEVDTTSFNGLSEFFCFGLIRECSHTCTHG